MSKSGNLFMDELEEANAQIIELASALLAIESAWKDSDSESSLAFEMAEIARKAHDKIIAN